MCAPLGAIREPWVQSPHAATPSFSQLAAPFFATQAKPSTGRLYSNNYSSLNLHSFMKTGFPLRKNPSQHPVSNAFFRKGLLQNFLFACARFEAERKRKYYFITMDSVGFEPTASCFSGSSLVKLSSPRKVLAKQARCHCATSPTYRSRRDMARLHIL